MAIIVETGSGASDSEALCSVAFADAYHLARANTAWAALSTADKEANLRKGYAYMQQTYRMRWAGYRSKNTQALDWPRQLVPRTDVYVGNGGKYGTWATYYDDDIVPLEVQQAQAEFAVKTAAGELLADVDAPVASETVGPISVAYFQGDLKTKRYPSIDRLLSPFLSGGGGNLKVARA